LFIDSLRGLAAMWVVFFHACAGQHIGVLLSALPTFVRDFMTHGDLGVQIFFVLSGFVIAHSMASNNVTFRYAGRFLLRRSLRLDPPYWASMVLVVVLGLVSSRAVAGKIFVVPSVGRVLAHVFYLQELLGVPPLNTIYWTLCLEVQFYVSFCLLMIIATRLRPRLGREAAFYATVLPAAAIANLWALHVEPFDVRGLFLSEWHLFLAGVLIWAAIAQPTARWIFWIAAGDLVLLALSALIFRSVTTAAGTLTAVSILVAGRCGGLSTWLGARPLQFLGRVSYSLYLVHNPITGAAFRIGYRFVNHGATSEGILFLVVVGVCVAVAYLLYLTVEKPSLMLSRRVRLAS
jgi:peptidoglycan/LPS O-acetylase OafA/YrhL